MRPLLRLHTTLAGGRLGTFGVPAVCLFAIVIIAAMSFRASEPRDYPSVSTIWLAIMAVSGIAVMLLLIPGTLSKAINRDFKNGMIDSHRLTPMSNLRIILGYIVGPPCQMFMLYVVTLILGSYFATSTAAPFSAGAMVAGWWTMHGFLILAALMLASFVGALAIAGGGKSQAMGLLLALGVLGGWLLVMFVPGLALVAGVLSGNVFANALNAGVIGDEGTVVIVGALSHIALTVLFIEAASRRLRTPDCPLFNMTSSLILATIWAVALVLGMEFAWRYGLLGRTEPEVLFIRVVASISVFVLIAQTALLAAATTRCRCDSANALAMPYSRGRHVVAQLMPLWVGLLAAAILIVLYEITPAGLQSRTFHQVARDPVRLGAMVLALCASFWLDANWIYIAKLRGKSVGWAIGLSALLLKILPVLAEAAQSAASDAMRHRGATAGHASGLLAGFSPIGTMLACNMKNGSYWPGLAVQVFLAIGAAVLARDVRRRTFATLAPPLIPPSGSGPPRSFA